MKTETSITAREAVTALFEKSNSRITSACANGERFNAEIAKAVSCKHAALAALAALTLAEGRQVSQLDWSPA